MVFSAAFIERAFVWGVSPSYLPRNNYAPLARLCKAQSSVRTALHPAAQITVLPLAMTMTMTLIGTFFSQQHLHGQGRSEGRIDSMWPSSSGVGFCGR